MNILELIKTACKKAGVDEKYAERVQKLFKIEKEDADIDSYVSLFKENVLPGIQEAETAAAEAARAAAVTEYEKTHNLKDGKPIENPPAPPAPGKLPENMDPTLKALIEKQSNDIAELTKLVGGVVKTTSSAQKLEQVKSKLKGKVDDKYIDRVAGKINLDAEDLDKEIEAQVKDHTEFVQLLINDTIGNNHQQQQSQQQDKMEIADWKNLMDGDSNTSTGTVDLGLGK